MVGCFGLFSCLRTCCNSTHSWDNRPFCNNSFLSSSKEELKRESDEQMRKQQNMVYLVQGRGEGGGGYFPYILIFSAEIGKPKRPPKS